MNNILNDCYQPLLEKNGFSLIEMPEQFNPAGMCWRLSPEIGSGFYWVYARKDLFDIKIHDFYFHEDSFMEFDMPECAFCGAQRPQMRFRAAALRSKTATRLMQVISC